MAERRADGAPAAATALAPGPAAPAPVRRSLALAGLAWTLFIIYQSLAGGSLGNCGTPLLQQGARLSFGDGLANLVAYLPLGLLLGAWLAPRRSVAVLVVAFLAIAGLSLTMELVQSCMAARVSSWFDLTMNSAGGLLGLLAAPWIARRRAGRSGPAVASGWQDLPLLWPVLLVAGAWLALSLAPWRVTFDVSTIRSNLAFLLHWAEWRPDPWRLARHLAGWLAVAVALRALWRRRLPASLALAALIGLALAGRLLLTRQALSFDELVALALAMGLAVAMPSFSSGPALARTLPVLALLSVAAYQLAPGVGTVLAGRFHWLPQLGRGSLLPALELSLMYGWLAFSLVLSLCWRRQCGQDIGRARYLLPAGVVVLMLATELAQAWIPGRVPDSSAPLLTALGFVVGWALCGAPQPGPAGRPGGRVADPGLRVRADPRGRRPAA